MTDSEFRERLSGNKCGNYLFFGEETYLKRYWLEMTRKTFAKEDDSAFDHVILNTDSGLSAMADAIMSPPFMSEYKLIELHEVDYSSISSEKMDTLLSAGAASGEMGNVVIVLYTEENEFDPGSLPKKPSAVYRKLTEVFEPVYFQKVTSGRLAAWLSKHFAHERIIAEPREIDEMIGRCGESMQVLANETDKLCSYLHSQGRDRLTGEDIELVCSCGIGEDDFALSNAILSRNRINAFGAVREMKSRHVEPVIALSGISRVCCELYGVSLLMDSGASKAAIAAKTKMHPYKVGLYMDAVKRWGKDRIKDSVRMCSEADASVKGFSGNYEPIEWLMSKIFLES